MRVLILAGTGEAAALAEALAARADCEVISSLAGRTRAPRRLPGALRSGGFGGAAGLGRFLAAERIDRLIDASHPFAAQIGRHAEEACRAAGVPRLRLLRPPWQAVAGDRWHEVADAAAAACLLPSLGRRAFLTVGHKDLAAFGAVDGAWFLVRTIEPPVGEPPSSAPLPRTLYLQARGPFTPEAEFLLLREHRIDVLVTKASGGEATYAKVAAARAQRLPVIMLRRPPPPPGPLAATVAEALAWLG